MSRREAAAVLGAFAWYGANWAAWCALTPRDIWGIGILFALLSGGASALILVAVYSLFRPAARLAEPES